MMVLGAAVSGCWVLGYWVLGAGVLGAAVSGYWVLVVLVLGAWVLGVLGAAAGCWVLGSGAQILKKTVGSKTLSSPRGAVRSLWTGARPAIACREGMRFTGRGTESNYGHGQTLPNKLHSLRSLQATNTSAPPKHSDNLVAIPRPKREKGGVKEN